MVRPTPGPYAGPSVGPWLGWTGPRFHVGAGQDPRLSYPVTLPDGGKPEDAPPGIDRGKRTPEGHGHLFIGQGPDIVPDKPVIFRGPMPALIDLLDFRRPRDR
jgi:hypothetical protein